MPVWLLLGLALWVGTPGTALGCLEPAGPAPRAAALKPTPVMLAITSPRAGETIDAPDGRLTISVEYWGPQLVEPEAARAIDQDHLAFFLDADPTPYVGTLIPMPKCDPRVAHSALMRWTFPDVSSGSHSAAVLLAGSNRVSVNPPVAARVTFMVK